MLFRNDRIFINLEDRPLVGHCSREDETIFSQWFPASNFTTAVHCSPGGMSLDLSDGRKWAGLVIPHWSQSGHPATYVSQSDLLTPYDALERYDQVDVAVERNVKDIIASCRRDVGMETIFDDNIAIVLQVSTS
jgi:hypothetical protein